MLKFENVSRVYPDGTVAVDKVDLEIPKGEFCVLIGPSGAGKSTLMNMINGLVEPTQGQIVFGGITMAKKNLQDIQQRTSMIHQQLHLIPRLAVLHNVLTGLLPKVGFWRSLIKSFPMELQRKACRLLAEVGLEEKHLYRRASELSGGQQQRVAIARAFLSEPEVVLADEPVANLDPVISRSVMESLKSASKHYNATVLCTLHQVEYAMEFADRIIVLRDGKLTFSGTPQELDEIGFDSVYGKVQTSNQASALEEPAVAAMPLNAGVQGGVA